jgi:dihydroorotase
MVLHKKMSTYLIQSALIIDPNGKYHQQQVDVLIEDGILSQIGNIQAQDHHKVISQNGLMIFPGFIDGQCFLGEPGFEDKETIHSGLQAAARGGFTGVCTTPNTQPKVQDKTGIEYQIRAAQGEICSIYPLGLLTTDDQTLAPILEMDEAGAVGFTNPGKAIRESGMLIRALEYTQQTGKRIFSFPIDNTVAPFGHMHEGEISTQLGMKAFPSMSETIQIQRDIELLRYSGGKLHIPTISARESISLIQSAKAEGLDITCSVAITNLVFNDNSVLGFGTEFKVSPPLRTENDRLALIQAVQDGIIDFVVSDHQPIDFDHKYCEFGLAKYGSIQIQTTVLDCLHLLGEETTALALSTRTRSALGLQEIKISEGNPAELTLITNQLPYTFTSEENLSISKNAQNFGKTYQHSVVGIINNNKSILYV